VEAEGAGAFVSDSAPIIYRLERAVAPALVSACDPLFDRVEDGDVACLVSAVTAAEVFAKPFRTGSAAVSVLDSFFQSPGISVCDVDYDIARSAAKMIAKAVRLPDALIGATALKLGLPLVTGDRRLACTVPGALLVSDFA
jgi:predicted nucleic acid-binding protein